MKDPLVKKTPQEIAKTLHYTVLLEWMEKNEEHWESIHIATEEELKPEKILQKLDDKGIKTVDGEKASEITTSILGSWNKNDCPCDDELPIKA